MRIVIFHYPLETSPFNDEFLRRNPSLTLLDKRYVIMTVDDFLKQILLYKDLELDLKGIPNPSEICKYIVRRVCIQATKSRRLTDIFLFVLVFQIKTQDARVCLSW